MSIYTYITYFLYFKNTSPSFRQGQMSHESFKVKHKGYFKSLRQTIYLSLSQVMNDVTDNFTGYHYNDLVNKVF